ncbi:MAG: anthranilate phosphoribosyltransferase [Candidatus Methanospirareceae archaeon]
MLKALGIRIDLPQERVKECIEKVGIGFLLAPVFHPAMKRVAGPRRELGVHTVFNIVGPLTNPAGASAQVIGVFDPALCETIAEVLSLLGSERAMVVHGDGMDEISNISETMIASLEDGEVSTYTVKPEDFGIARAVIGDIAGGTPEENAPTSYRYLRGRKGRSGMLWCLIPVLRSMFPGWCLIWKQGFGRRKRSSIVVLRLASCVSLLSLRGESVSKGEAVRIISASVQSRRTSAAAVMPSGAGSPPAVKYVFMGCVVVCYACIEEDSAIISIWICC